MHAPSSDKGPGVTHSWRVRVFRWLWRFLTAIAVLIIAPLLVNELGTWLNSSNGIIPADSPLDWLITHWPITVSISAILSLIAFLIWFFSREQARHLIMPQERRSMIERLRLYYQDWLTQSLQETARFELGFSSKLEAVQHTTNLILRLPTSSEHALPPVTKILQVYDEAGHELLILGEPGSGKSTCLLELAQYLVERAAKDASQPMPVILPLSSWANKHPPLQDWLGAELTRLYNVSRPLSQQLVQEQQILPLLEGLDEMEESSRVACIRAINRYHHEHLLPLVICSRIAEYEAVSERERFNLNRAYVILPLKAEQVERSLLQGGPSLAALRDILKENPLLRELTTIPLWLNILIRTYQGGPVPEPGSVQQAFANYIEHMVKFKGNMKRYPLHQTSRWLRLLARQMRENGQTIFYLDQIQSGWLPESQRHLYRWSIRLGGGLVGGLVGGLAGGLAGRLAFGSAGGLVSGLVFGLILSVVFGLGGEQAFRLESGENPTNTSIWSWRDGLSRLLSALLAGLTGGLALGLTAGLLSGVQTGLQSGLTAGLSLGAIGVIVGLSAGLFGKLKLPSWFKGKPRTEHLRISPNDAIGRSASNGLFFGLVIGLAGGLISWPAGGTIFGVFFGLLVGLLVGLVLGLLAVVQHYVLVTGSLACILSL